MRWKMSYTQRMPWIALNAVAADMALPTVQPHAVMPRCQQTLAPGAWFAMRATTKLMAILQKKAWITMPFSACKPGVGCVGCWVEVLGGLDSEIKVYSHLLALRKRCMEGLSDELCPQSSKLP